MVQKQRVYNKFKMRILWTFKNCITFEIDNSQGQMQSILVLPDQFLFVLRIDRPPHYAYENSYPG